MQLNSELDLARNVIWRLFFLSTIPQPKKKIVEKLFGMKVKSLYISSYRIIIINSLHHRHVFAIGSLFPNTNIIVNIFLYQNDFHRFRFWQWGRWIEVNVDDRLPTRGDRPAHMHCAQPDVYWAALLEKAYAKLYGGYAFLKYGYDLSTCCKFV